MSIGSSVPKRIYSAFICIITLTYFFFGTVDSVSAAGTTRYVATTGSDVGVCNSSASPCRNIQYAVNQSNATAGDIIKVALGNYTYSASLNACTFLLTRAVVCVLNKNLTILGGYTTGNWSMANPSVNLTLIDGANTYRGVVVQNYQSTTAFLDMEGFTIQNGRAQGPTYNSPYDPSGIGGGMWVTLAAVTLIDVIFRDNQAIGQNTASGAGGAAAGSGLRIDNSLTGTSSLLQRVTFDGNRSTGGTGPDRGGVSFGALFIYASTVTVQDSTFTDNIAQAGSSTGNGTSGGLNADALGGAIGLELSSVVIDGIVATGNLAIGGNATTNPGGAFGGAIFAEDCTSLTISDSDVYGNTAQAGNAATGGFGAGGGVMVYNTPATIDRVELVNNSAIGGNGTGNAGPGGGGGLYLWRSKNVNANSTVTNAIISDNYVTMGSTGTGNYSLGGGGGGIQIQGLTATITHATIARNRLGPQLVSGQAVVVLAAPGVSSATANINKSIIADHTVGGSGAAAILVQAGNTINFNGGLFAGNTKNTNSDGSPSPVGTINGLESMQSDASAGFVSPGSPNYDYHLRFDSPAKDQATGSTTADDMDGQDRPYNSVSDLGADEYWLFPLFAVAGNSALHLTWIPGPSVLEGGVDHYEIIITCSDGANPPDQGSCGQPIDVGTVTTFTLTGLSNFMEYTLIVYARDTLAAVIANSTTVTIFPTNLLVYLPLIVR